VGRRRGGGRVGRGAGGGDFAAEPGALALAWEGGDVEGKGGGGRRNRVGVWGKVGGDGEGRGGQLLVGHGRRRRRERLRLFDKSGVFTGRDMGTRLCICAGGRREGGKALVLTPSSLGNVKTSPSSTATAGKIVKLREAV
jgi:hypothetical protein